MFFVLRWPRCQPKCPWMARNWARLVTHHSLVWTIWRWTQSLPRWDCWMKIEFREALTVKHLKTLPLAPRSLRCFPNPLLILDLFTVALCCTLFLKSSADFRFPRTIPLTHFAAAWSIQPNPVTFLTNPILVIILPQLRRRSRYFRKKEPSSLPTYEVDPNINQFLSRERILAPHYIWSRSLSFFLSALVCDLLPRRLFHGLAKGALPEEYFSHNFDEHCLEDTRFIWCLSHPIGGAPLIPGCYVSG